MCHVTAATMSFKLIAPNGSAYSNLSTAEQQKVKHEILTHFTESLAPIIAFLQKWQSFNIVVDDSFHNSLPPVRDLITGELNVANSLLAQNKVLSVGASEYSMICTKTPDCGHKCRSSFMMMQGGAPWTVSGQDSTGKSISVNVYVELEWTTPPAITSAHDH